MINAAHSGLSLRLIKTKSGQVEGHGIYVNTMGNQGSANDDPYYEANPGSNSEQKVASSGQKPMSKSGNAGRAFFPANPAENNEVQKLPQEQRAISSTEKHV